MGKSSTFFFSLSLSIGNTSNLAKNYGGLQPQTLWCLRACQNMINFRSSSSEVFCKKGVLRNFAKLTGKHLCQSLFFNKVAELKLDFLFTDLCQHFEIYLVVFALNFLFMGMDNRWCKVIWVVGKKSYNHNRNIKPEI